MAKGFLGGTGYKAYLGAVKLKAGYIGAQRVYSAGNVVTYYVDTNLIKREEVDSGASCLAPKTFTPAKSGWIFVGWRQDTAANGTVLTSKVMGDAPITLYAVFRQTITLSYAGNTNNSGSTAAQTGTRYYNNGKIASPTFALRANGFVKNYYTWVSWALGSASGTRYAAGAYVTLSANTTFYAVWTATVVNTSKTLNYEIGKNIGRGPNLIGNRMVFAGDTAGSGGLGVAVLFTAPYKCILSGTLTLTVSQWDQPIKYINTVVHKNVAMQNGQTWANTVASNPWNENNMELTGTKSKSFSVTMNANEKLMVWALDLKGRADFGKFTLSLSGSYQSC